LALLSPGQGGGQGTAMRIERRLPPLPSGERVAAKRPGEGVSQSARTLGVSG
jgi:hypothetical protein